MSKEKTVWVATHGDKHFGTNPRMTGKGHEQIRRLGKFLPISITSQDVICGTGERHIDVAIALRVTPTSYTACVGGPESLENVEEYFQFLQRVKEGGEASGPALQHWAHLNHFKKQGVKKVVVLANGQMVPREQYTTPEDGRASMMHVILKTKDNTLICAGRPAMIMLGENDQTAKSAALYKITQEGGAFKNIEMIACMDGVAEPGTV